MSRPGGTLVVPHRFRGPTGSGNGGWTAGSAAALLPGADAVRVRLSAPPPLETPIRVTPAPGGDGPVRGLVAVQDGRRVLEATALDAGEALAALHDVPPVGFEEALDAGERYPGLHGHPFPQCFACGPARASGDGLRLRPGPVHHGVAAAWVPDPSVDGGDGAVAGPVVWAALDCPGGWSVDVVGRPMVLGTMTAQVSAQPRVGERCVVTGVALRSEERKALTATALYGEDGAVLARAAHVWIAVDPAAFGPG